MRPMTCQSNYQTTVEDCARIGDLLNSCKLSGAGPNVFMLHSYC